MSRFLRFSLVLAVAAFCAIAQQSDLKPTVILISFDGFRPDYIDRTSSPNFHRFVTEGVRAKAMYSCFPSKTFPNHYSIVTGLYPEHHGIVSNNFFDPELNETYNAFRDIAKETRWYGGEPIWVTAESQGQIAASFFWVGSEVSIKGRQPSRWKKYDHNFPNAQRVDTVLSWLDLPASIRPSCITLYFALLDDAGHRSGPDSPNTMFVVEQADSVVGRLIAGLENRKLLDKVNIVIVSDHGMSQLSPDRVVYLEDYIDSTDSRVVDWSPVAALIPASGREEKVYDALKNAHPNLKLYRKNEIPELWHYRDNPRISQLLAVADDGWTIARRRSQRGERRLSGGNHGYDPRLPSMHALFLARGPVFKQRFVAEPFENIHVYSLLCKILSLTTAPNDGDLRHIMNILR
ncbi:MAG: alkaline phosphatase family protein [Ignavibacteriales bacterium]|nr:alkaline phosphatase family protein [Ignavibacteriales bacterium]